jgi:hypothetical protein
MKKDKKIIYGLSFLIVLGASASIDYIKDYIQTPAVVTVDDDEKNPFLEKVTEEFNNIENNDDRLLIHKIFSGSASFLEVCDNLKGTHEFDPILGRVQNNYSWDREKYPSFTDAVSYYLIDVDFDIPKPLETEDQRLAFAKIFRDLSEATKYE